LHPTGIHGAGRLCRTREALRAISAIRSEGAVCVSVWRAFGSAFGTTIGTAIRTAVTAIASTIASSVAASATAAAAAAEAAAVAILIGGIAGLRGAARSGRRLRFRSVALGELLV
jgi:CHASE3 domain sensor protein